MPITTDRQGRRTYFRGDTFPFRTELRDASAHWDADAGAWWIGSDSEAQALVAKLNAAQPSASFTKLADGAWGVRGRGFVAGAKVTVRKASGAEVEETIAAILSVDAEGKQTASLVPRSKPSSSGGSAYQRRWTPCGYPGCSPNFCDECDGKGRAGEMADTYGRGRGRYGRRY